MLDLHGTLLDSNTAWLEALREIDPNNIDYYEAGIWGKMSRRDMAKHANVSYECLKSKYRSKLKPRSGVLDFVKVLSANYPLIIVSNAKRKDILDDMGYLSQLQVERIYSKEDGNKPEMRYLERILVEMCWDSAYLIGNDFIEDFTYSKRVMSIIIPYCQSHKKREFEGINSLNCSVAKIDKEKLAMDV